MIYISKTQDYQLIKDIICIPALFRLTYGQGLTTKEYKVEENFDYYLVLWDHENLALWQTREFTKKVLEVHIYVLPKFWGTEIPVLVTNKFKDYLRQNTDYTSMMTDVPVDCISVHRLCEKIEAKCIGLIRNGCVYNNRPQDLILYQYEL